MERRVKIEVTRPENLVYLMGAMSDATVTRLCGDGDCWRVEYTLCDTGPTRVVVETKNGHVEEAVPAYCAEERGIIPELVFVRQDGWTLGCTYRDALPTERSWSKQWVAVLHCKFGETITAVNGQFLAGDLTECAGKPHQPDEAGECSECGAATPTRAHKQCPTGSGCRTFGVQCPGCGKQFARTPDNDDPLCSKCRNIIGPCP